MYYCPGLSKVCSELKLCECKADIEKHSIPIFGTYCGGVDTLTLTQNFKKLDKIHLR